MRSSLSNLKRLVFRRLERLQAHTNRDLSLNDSWSCLQKTLEVAFPVPNAMDMDFSRKMELHKRAVKISELITIIRADEWEGE